MRKPEIGEDVYVGTSLYVYRGRDDFHGGLCKIAKINESGHLPKDHYNYLFVEVEERPGTSYNWNALMEEQEKLKEQFGETRGYPDPDDDPEMNDDNADWK